MEKAMTYPLTLKCPALDTCLVDGDDDDDDADGDGVVKLRPMQIKTKKRPCKLSG